MRSSLFYRGDTEKLLPSEVSLRGSCSQLSVGHQPLAAKRANGILGCKNHSISICSNLVIILLCSVLVGAVCNLRKIRRFLNASRGGQVSWWTGWKPVLWGAAEHSGFVWFEEESEGWPHCPLWLPEKETWRVRCWTLLPAASKNDAWEWFKTSPAEV